MSFKRPQTRVSRGRLVYPELAVSNVPAYLSCLEAEVEASEFWNPAKKHGTGPAVVAEYSGPAFDGTGLCVCAGHWRDDTEGDTVMFAVLAKRWKANGSSPASTGELIEAFLLFRPLARRAARAAGLPCRIRYPRDRPPHPVPKGIVAALDAFCAAANTACLHPFDKERFLWFVRLCHSRRFDRDTGWLTAEMRRRGIPEAMALRLAAHYDFGRSLLSNNSRPVLAEWG